MNVGATRMTSRDRLAAAMDGRPHDRVPVMCQMSIGHMLLRLGGSPATFWFDPSVYAEGLVRLADDYSFDGILVSLHGHDPGWKSRVRATSMTPDGEAVEWTDGTTTVHPSDDLPLAATDRSPNAPDAPLPPEIWYIPVSQGLRFSIHPRHRFDIFGLVRSTAGPDRSIHGEVTSAFDYYLDWLGHEQGLMLLIDDPERAQAILAHFARGIASLASDMCREDIDAVKLSSPFAGAGFLSREQYARFVLPHERTVVAAVRAAGKRAYVHTCGAIGDRLDLLASTGADGLECLDPPPLGTIDLADALRSIDDSMFVKGNIDPVNTMLLGTAAIVERDAEQRLRSAARSRRFILSTACSIAPRVPAEHVRLLSAMVERAGQRDRLVSA